MKKQYLPFQAMSEEQLKAFLEAVKTDAGLQEQLQAAGNADAVVAIANAQGFVISVQELKRAQAEVSDEELEGMSGGGTSNWRMISLAPQCGQCCLGTS